MSSCGATCSRIHLPYALALQRSEVQRQILVQATHGRATLDDIDWEALARTVHARLPVLEDAR